MKKETKILVVKIILGVVASAGILTVAAVAPNALKAVDLFYPKEKRKYHQGYYVRKSITKLRVSGLIKFEKRNGKTFVKLTEKGQQELLRYQLKETVIKKAKEVYEMLKKDISPIEFDDNGNIGKRYRRQDEIGTPFCITVDFDTLENDSVTIRDRDTGKQERLDMKEVLVYLQKRLK